MWKPQASTISTYIKFILIYHAYTFRNRYKTWIYINIYIYTGTTSYRIFLNSIFIWFNMIRRSGKSAYTHDTLAVFLFLQASCWVHINDLWSLIRISMPCTWCKWRTGISHSISLLICQHLILSYTMAELEKCTTHMVSCIIHVILG